MSPNGLQIRHKIEAGWFCLHSSLDDDVYLSLRELDTDTALTITGTPLCYIWFRSRRAHCFDSYLAQHCLADSADPMWACKLVVARTAAKMKGSRSIYYLIESRKLLFRGAKLRMRKQQVSGIVNPANQHRSLKRMPVPCMQRKLQHGNLHSRASLQLPSQFRM